MSVPFQTHPEEAEGTLKRFLFMQLHSISSTVTSCLSSLLLQAIGLVQCTGQFAVCDICNLTFIFFGILETKHSLKKYCSLRAKYIPKGKVKGPTATHHRNKQRRSRNIAVCLFSWHYNPWWLYFHSPVVGFSLPVFEVSRSNTTRHSR
jgi:hypothetical protein